MDSEGMRAAIGAQSLCFNSRESICGWIIPCLFFDSRPCFSPLSSASAPVSSASKLLQERKDYCHIQILLLKSAKVTPADWNQSGRRTFWSKNGCFGSWGEGQVRATTTADIGFIHHKKQKSHCSSKRCHQSREQMHELHQVLTWFSFEAYVGTHQF